MPKYYPIIKQVYILQKSCTVNPPPNPPESFVSDFCHAGNCPPPCPRHSWPSLKAWKELW